MNPLLEKTKQAILQSADERLRPVIQKVVDAGLKVMFSPETRELTLRQLKGGADPEAIGAGAAKLMGVLFNQSKGTIPMQAAIPASTILLCEALQFLEDAGVAQVNQDLLAQSMKATGSSILQMFGVTPDKLQGMIGNQQQPGIVAAARGGV